MRALVTGWFSFEDMGGTAGDLYVRDVIGAWLDEISCPYDIALSPRLGGGIALDRIDPARYTHLIFACGPLGAGEPALSLLQRFGHARRIGVNLSMLDPVEDWNPFDLLLERDSSRAARPDLAILAKEPRVPVVGLILVHEQKEYASGRHAIVHRLIREFLADVQAAVVNIDTCLDPPNTTGLRSAAEIESLIARMDVVVTTRLHGLVLSLKNGVPVVAVDPISGGAKIARQAEVLGWPHALTPETLTPETVRSAFTEALKPSSRALALACAKAAIHQHVATKEAFAQAFY
jgi:hypothetical protein